jgi:trans-aconitate methyltransferase
MEDTNKNQKVHWNATGYDEAMSFVSQYGEDLVKWLNPQKGERVVDFGCGTGDLAAQIAFFGSEVMGVDISPEMVERARNKYPQLIFQCADGMKWNAGKTYDAVFSNAALHWMKDAEAAIAGMVASLRPGGRLIAEFGGHRNVEAIVTAVKETLKSNGREDVFVMPWYFPTVGEYSSLLEKAGLEVRKAVLFDRPTRLDNGEDGMKDWLHMFGKAMFPNTGILESIAWIEEAAERLKEPLFRQGHWTADYRRLRVFAVK